VLNSVVLDYHDGRLQLAHLPELELMLKPEIKNQIKASIEKKLSVSLAVEFVARPTLGVETPQQASLREQEEERRAAILRIREHGMVRQLKRLFNAELVETSVRKHNTQ
jgi:hypothetical protein